jgi:hypothetical protein
LLPRRSDDDDHHIGSGLALIVVAAVFFVWAALRPVPVEEIASATTDSDEPPVG